MTDNSEIEFNEKKHEYKILGKKAISVTQFIDKFFDKFDVKRMSKIVAKKRRNSGEKNIKGKPITAWDVKKEWKQAGEVAMAQGNLVHKELEDWLSGRLDPAVYEVLHPMTKQGILWSEELLGHEVVCEKIIYNKDLLLAGTIDLLYITIDGVIKLADWKTSKKGIQKKYGKLKNKTLAPFEIPNSKLYKYYLQLNLYKRLLELNGEEVSTMKVVQVLNDEFIEFDAPDMTEVVDSMLECRKGELNEME